MAEEDKKTQPFYQKWWFWTLIVLIIIFVMTQGDDEDIQEDVTGNEQTEEIEDADEQADESTEELEEAQDDLNDVNSGTLTADEEEYVDFMNDHTDRMSNVFFDFSDLLSQTERYYSDDWINEVALQLVLMEQYANEAIEMEAPSERFNQAHQYYTQAMEQYLIVATEFPEAFDNDDAEHLDRLIGNIEQGNIYMGMATDEITNIE